MLIKKDPIDFVKRNCSELERQILDVILGSKEQKLPLGFEEEGINFSKINQLYNWILWGICHKETIDKFLKFCITHQQDNGSWSIPHNTNNRIESKIIDEENVWLTSRIALCLMKLNLENTKPIEKAVNYITKFVNKNGFIGSQLSSTWAALATLYNYGVNYQDPIIQKGIKVLTRAFYRKTWCTEELIDLLLSLQELGISENIYWRTMRQGLF